MKSKMIGTVEADDKNKWFAAQDARMQSAINATSFTQAKCLAAQRMVVALGLCYSSPLIVLNYRKTMASVKVAKPFELRDRKGLRALEKQWEALGYKKKDSPQGFSYQIPK